MASSADPPAGAGGDGNDPDPPAGWPRAALFSLKDKGEGGASPPVLGGFPRPGRGALDSLRTTAGRIFAPSSSSPAGSAAPSGSGAAPSPPLSVYATLSGVGASGGPLLALLHDDAALETVSMN